MKKLLAIAVAAAFTAPMMASADVTVGGNLNQEYHFGANGAEQIVDDGGDNEITFRASTPLYNGMTGTASVNHEFNAAQGGTDSTNGKLGIKGGFGHVTIGKVSNVTDQIDGNTGFFPQSGRFGDGSGTQGINYTGAFGPIGLYAMGRPQQVPTATPAGTGTEHQVGVTYKAGPFSLGAAVSKSNLNADAKNRISLAYGGANYNLGLNFDEAEGGAKSTTIGGKYNFGRAYVAASVGKKQGASHNAVELGYALGKSTSVYLVSAKGVAGATGLSTDPDATENADRTNTIGINQKF